MRRRASFVTPAVPTLVVLVLAGPVTAGAGTPAVPLVESPLPAGSVRGIGGYVGQRFRANQDGYLKVFDIDRYTRMIEAKTYRDWWFIGEQPGKWLESAVLTSRATGDRALETRAREVLARLVAAQEPGGYLGITDPAIRTDQRPLRGMEPYELYFLLHGLLTAAEAWDDAAALRAAGALGDYLFGSRSPVFWVVCA
jgi:uncharacterized protein